MDRQSIERRDFPIARRGYEIEAVDAHLAALADEYEDVARRGRTTSIGGLASSAADQVRMIVEAAEQSAADIEREAQLEARQLRQDAREEAERLRGDAGRQARDHVTRVAEVARGLLDRVEGIDRELGGLLDGPRSGTQRLSADLSLLQGSVEEVREAVAAPASGANPPAAGSEPAGAPAGSPTVADEDLPPAELDGASAPATGDGGRAATGATAADDLPSEDGRATSGSAPADPEPVPVEEAGPGSAAPAAPAAWEPDAPPSSAERDGARMVALNMALNGVPREDTRHHIEENFDVGDVGSLLDEVYARAGR